MTDTALHGIPGGQALIEWFGHVPHFHDAYLLDITLATKGPSTLRVHAFQITDRVDDQGYFILDKHVVVIFSLDEVSCVALTDFNLPGIIFDLEITHGDLGFELVWSGSYGVSGTLRAQHQHRLSRRKT